MDIKLSPKLNKQIHSKRSSEGLYRGLKNFNWKKMYLDFLKGKEDNFEISKWNFLIPLLITGVSVVFVISALVRLQLVDGEELYARSVDNHLETAEIPAYRGIIFDRNGKKLAQNVPSIDLYLDLREYRDELGDIDQVKLVDVLDKVSNIVKSEKGIKERIVENLEQMSATERFLTGRILLSKSVGNTVALEVKADPQYFLGVTVENSSKREYPFGVEFAHILGYTGEVFAEDIEQLSYVGLNDVIGKSGIEKTYNEELFGENGEVAREVDAYGNIVSQEVLNVKEPVSGDSLYLSIDAQAQEQLYAILKAGVKAHGATGGAGILEDVNTGEILSLVSFPGYDNNDFVEGISEKAFSKLLNDPRSPLTNKAIAAQVPPGSTFKTIVAAAALDAGEITRSTTFFSSSSYTFSNGAPFQEYQNHAYGTLDLISAISVSSNIYFCETIRRWDINELVPYLINFGIGQYTYIDIPGEGRGMLPSPENKKRLAQTSSPWLDEIWYPEGDSCNSVIGQGITAVTPIQMANWVAAIANGGTLNTPHLASEYVDHNGAVSPVKNEPLKTKIVGKDALKIVREGMWASTNGPRRVVYPLTDAKVTVAAKTGTAEFGKLNSEGVYEHTHAWVTGFFPYEDPKYSFVIFLEDGGESYNSALLAREFVDWWVDYTK